MPNARNVIGEPTLKELLFKAATVAYPEGTLTISDYSPGHPKLHARRLVHAHVGIRVGFETADGVTYGIAGMLPATASETDVTELIARLADNKRRAEVAATPTGPV